jgi:hypothetical protein
MALWGEISARKWQLVVLVPQLAPHELGILTSLAADDQETLRDWLPRTASTPMKQAADVLCGRISEKLTIDATLPAESRTSALAHAAKSGSVTAEIARTK